jgi:hypothetical protein
MKFRHACLFAGAVLLPVAGAFAGTCTIEITGPREQYKFVQVHDVAARAIVMRKAIKSGQSREVTVSGDRVRVDWKFAGGTSYQSGKVQACNGGRRIRI